MTRLRLTKNQASLLAKLRAGETFHDLPIGRACAANLAVLVSHGLARRCPPRRSPCGLPMGPGGWEAVRS
jgi:hypothetical protein